MKPTIYSINGREVSVFFSESRNDSVCSRVKAILLSSFVNGISPGKLAIAVGMRDNISSGPCQPNNCPSQLL